MAWEQLLRRILNDPRVIQQMSDHPIMRSAARNSISLYFRTIDKITQVHGLPGKAVYDRFARLTSNFKTEYKKAIEMQKNAEEYTRRLSQKKD